MPHAAWLALVQGLASSRVLRSLDIGGGDITSGVIEALFAALCGDVVSEEVSGPSSTTGDATGGGGSRARRGVPAIKHIRLFEAPITSFAAALLGDSMRRGAKLKSLKLDDRDGSGEKTVAGQVARALIDLGAAGRLQKLDLTESNSDGGGALPIASSTAPDGRLIDWRRVPPPAATPEHSKGR